MIENGLRYIRNTPEKTDKDQNDHNLDYENPKNGVKKYDPCRTKNKKRSVSTFFFFEKRQKSDPDFKKNQKKLNFYFSDFKI